jgi:hypothetical protein
MCYSVVDSRIREADEHRERVSFRVEANLGASGRHRLGIDGHVERVRVAEGCLKLPPRAPPPVLPIFDPTVSSGPSDSAAPARAAAAATPPPSLLAPEPTPNALRLAAPFGSALERRAPTLGSVIDLHAFGDSYTSYDPAPPSALAGAARLLDRLAPIRTHERAIQDIDGLFFGVVFGFTISQLDLVRKSQHGIEAIQVIKPDGSSNLV